MRSRQGSVPRRRSPFAAAWLAWGLVGAALAGLPGATRAVAATATYVVTFTATWSEQTHPVDFPANPHFSGLIGGIHDAGVSFWEPGALASDGIERMAEWGSQADLAAEVEAAITAGRAQAVLWGDIVNRSPGSTSLEFSIDSSHSLVTLVTMVAPSPDWFVGVSGLDLWDGGGWRPLVNVTLWPYDAGTDDGVSYTSANVEPIPHQPIGLITSDPLGNGTPLGTFTFTLTGPTGVAPDAGLALGIAPNPFNPTAEIRFELPREGRVRLEVLDLAGRRLQTLLDEVRSAGAHRLLYRPADLASGTYLYRLRTREGERVGKMTLLR